jgi:hypothetical protein
MITQHSVIINNYRMIKRLSPVHAQVIVCMIPANHMAGCVSKVHVSLAQIKTVRGIQIFLHNSSLKT